MKTVQEQVWLFCRSLGIARVGLTVCGVTVTDSDQMFSAPHGSWARLCVAAKATPKAMGSANARETWAADRMRHRVHCNDRMDNL